VYEKLARFRFYEELNDFLPLRDRKKTLPYDFNGSPAIKDAVEALGVPHTEVDLILVNGESVGFDYHLRHGDRVAVYPMFESVDVAPITRLRQRPLRRSKFVVDVHLGKLARLLRMLGFDTIYARNLTDAGVIEAAREGERIILTRDRSILKIRTVTHGYWLRSTHPDTQVREVLNRFDLRGQIKPFCRCMVCNGLIVAVDRQTAAGRVPDIAARCFDEFSECGECGKIYWKGSHYQKMATLVDVLRGGSWAPKKEE